MATPTGRERLNEAPRDLASSTEPTGTAMQLDLATVLLQWATGGLLFCWVTTRRREVGIGYGWLLRIAFGVAGDPRRSCGLRRRRHRRASPQRRRRGDGVAAAIALWSRTCAAAPACAASASGDARRRARVAAMVGTAPSDDADGARRRADGVRPAARPASRRSPAWSRSLGAASFVGGDYALSLVRLVVGAVFLGAVTDAMLLGHWYLVQPGLGRDPIQELVKIVAVLWPLEVVVCLIPHRHGVGARTAPIDDGYDGLHRVDVGRRVRSPRSAS